MQAKHSPHSKSQPKVRESLLQCICAWCSESVILELNQTLRYSHGICQKHKVLLLAKQSIVR